MGLHLLCPPPRQHACGGGSSEGGSLLDESFSPLTRTTVFTFFHHSVQIPAGLLALFSLDKKQKKTGRFAVYLPPPSASGTYYGGMGTQPWIIRITAGLVEGRDSWQG